MIRKIVSGIFAVLVMASSAAAAENCTIPTDNEREVRTAKCLLNVDGKLLVNERCNFHVSPDGHRTTLDAGKYYFEVVTPVGGQRGEIARWNRGSGRSDQLVTLGPAFGLDRTDAFCYHNRRFEMCGSEYMTCKCSLNEEYGCRHDESGQ
ncbi:hypothetical protein ACQR0V_27430 [Bradyrhizobium sp. HKCCYLS2058]|uniref:hypothetical protein n=1 Tax=unclassified Bradyrhizobium TaxID=2631580 RepID=UPI003EBBE758